MQRFATPPRQVRFLSSPPISPKTPLKAGSFFVYPHFYPASLNRLNFDAARETLLPLGQFFLTPTHCSCIDLNRLGKRSGLDALVEDCTLDAD